MRADWLPIRIGPTDAPERQFSILILHAKDAGQGEGLGLRRKEEMLGHLRIPRFSYLTYMLGSKPGLVNGDLSDMLGHIFDRMTL